MKPTRLLPTSAPRDRGPRLARGLPLANSAGLTLIECLVAIVMVALVASAITPVLVLSVATRVQSQKAEQAMALGQSEIDRVRSLVDRGRQEDYTALINQVPQAPNTVADSAPATQVGAAVGLANIANRTNAAAFPSSPTETRQVDVNGDGTPDFVVQTFRTRGLRDINNNPVAFALGVRVYDYDAVANGTGGNLETIPISLGITGGSGLRARRPIAAFYTTVTASERGDSLCDLLRYSQSTTGVTVVRPPGCPP